MRIWAMVLASVMAGTAWSQALHPDDRINDARNAAAGYAIGLDLATHGLARSCAAYGGDAKMRMGEARERWRRRNVALVDVAHRYLEHVRARIAAADGAQAGQAWYDARRAELQGEAQKSLESRFDGIEDAFAVCRRLARSLEQRELDIAARDEQAAVLRAMLLELPAPKARRR